MNTSSLPVAVIGAGPVGLAAAAHLLSRSERPILLEAGSAPAANIRQWAHVRTFSAWRENVDSVAREMLEASGWQPPVWNEAPTGGEFIDRYLQPLADLQPIREHLRLGARVTGISRLGFDKMKSGDRDNAPFLLQVSLRDGSRESLLARAVIDASGTFSSPNPLGAFGVPAQGEAEAADRIFYGIADVLDAQRDRYAGRRVLVVGSGHSAFNALLDLAKLQNAEPATTVTWAIRSTPDPAMYGGGAGDALPLRGALGTAMKDLVGSGKLRFVSGFPITALRQDDGGVYVRSFDGELGPFDEIVCATGFRPDLSLTRELRVALDPTVEAPPALAPLIDPNVHSCGTVPPHGVEELSHPEPGFYIVGMKSYGRAPTFLMLTGYEQVRSVVAELVGDHAAAREVRLELPATGVCNTGGPQLDAATATAASGCCGPITKSVIDLGSVEAADSSCATPVAAGAAGGGCR
ncbi:NAD(P)-binding domain-containing protein [bacterium]|nr:NAD(P)-binding domain-containing protein [bacterium]